MEKLRWLQQRGVDRGASKKRCKGGARGDTKCASAVCDVHVSRVLFGGRIAFEASDCNIIMGLHSTWYAGTASFQPFMFGGFVSFPKHL